MYSIYMIKPIVVSVSAKNKPIFDQVEAIIKTSSVTRTDVIFYCLSKGLKDGSIQQLVEQ